MAARNRPVLPQKGSFIVALYVRARGFGVWELRCFGSGTVNALPGQRSGRRACVQPSKAPEPWRTPRRYREVLECEVLRRFGSGAVPEPKTGSSGKFVPGRITQRDSGTGNAPAPSDASRGRVSVVVKILPLWSAPAERSGDGALAGGGAAGGVLGN